MTKHGTVVSLCVAFPYKLTIYSWGCSKDGQLSSSDKSDQNKPTCVDSLCGVGVKQISWSSGHTVFLTGEGGV